MEQASQDLGNGARDPGPGRGKHGTEARGVQHPAQEEEVEREGVGGHAPAAHTPVEEERVLRSRGGAEASAERGVEEEGGAGHSVEQAERVAEVERVAGGNAAGEGVGEVRGGGLVEEAAGGSEDSVELRHGRSEGSAMAPGSSHVAAARDEERRPSLFYFMMMKWARASV
ncbi:hypothetical protein TRIUR3_03867 [Triticum urartu]|uniref:Uncharacterized protein n=1 Tax=Triticum urartu TaxID=4572 RepID=M7ZMJ0_TRIUA|nr:hypothetical protein TRIUR3_03867 [Triticum urartu]